MPFQSKMMPNIVTRTIDFHGRGFHTGRVTFQTRRIKLDIPDGPEYDQVRDMHGHTVTVFASTEINGERSLKIGSRTLQLRKVGTEEDEEGPMDVYRAESISEPSY
ncbi:hypothetical protein [Streptosporangium sp. NPDC048865]|uniref:hypothetical protein n=1 Tax=Streptosporangium sp. NPDC048865 TaxID=3155766 RepID=UPI00342A0FE3